jgi:hypothetical protein
VAKTRPAPKGPLIESDYRGPLSNSAQGPPGRLPFWTGQNCSRTREQLPQTSAKIGGLSTPVALDPAGLACVFPSSRC